MCGRNQSLERLMVMLPNIVTHLSDSYLFVSLFKQRHLHWQMWPVLSTGSQTTFCELTEGCGSRGDLHPHFSSVAQSCPTLCDPLNCSTLGLPVHHQLPELTQTHVHQVGDAIQPSHSLSSPSPPALNLSQHQCLFQLVSSLHQVAKVLEFQLQHHSFQWISRTDFL